MRGSRLVAKSCIVVVLLFAAGCATPSPDRPRLVPGANGVAVMECMVGRDGRLNDCRILSETPEGRGLGEATLALAARFNMRETTRNGLPTVGSRVRIPIQWRLDEDGALSSTSELDLPPPEA